MDERDDRRRARAGLPIRIHPLREAPPDNLRAYTTDAERWNMVVDLTLQAWDIAGLELPDYTRSSAPIRVRRLHDPT